MKRILSSLFALFLLFSLAGFAFGEANEVLWSDVVTAFYDDSVSFPTGITVAHKGNNYVISGNGADTVLKNVIIDSRDDSTSFGAGSYTFRNLTLDGEFSIISEENKTYTLVLEESVYAENDGIELYSGKYISNGKHNPPTELYHGSIHATIHCKTKSITAYADYNSDIELYNYGDTHRIDVRPYNNSEIILKNYGSFAVKNLENIVPSPDGFGTLFMETTNNSTLDVLNNSPHTQVMYVWAYEDSRLNIINNGNSDRISIESTYNSNVCFTNNGTITNRRVDDGNEWGDDNIDFRMDETSTLTLNGSGKILPGHQHYTYNLEGHINGVECSNDPDHPDGVPGPSIVLCTRDNFSDDVTYEQVEDTVHKIAENINLDWGQIVTDKKILFPVVAVRRGETDYDTGITVEAIVCPIQLNDMNSTPMPSPMPTPTPTPTPTLTPTPTPTPNIGDIIGGEDDFGNLPPVDVPTLILPDGVVMDASAILQYDKPNANKKNTVVYNVHLINQNGEALDLPAGAILCFPYPEGLDENSGNKYRIIIHHYADNGSTEVFKSENGDIEFAKQGLCIRVSSFSPFEISWEEQPEIDLPQTGDNSHIVLWTALLTLAGAAILTLKRKIA